MTGCSISSGTPVLARAPRHNHLHIAQQEAAAYVLRGEGDGPPLGQVQGQARQLLSALAGIGCRETDVMQRNSSMRSMLMVITEHPPVPERWLAGQVRFILLQVLPSHRHRLHPQAS